MFNRNTRIGRLCTSIAVILTTFGVATLITLTTNQRSLFNANCEGNTRITFGYDVNTRTEAWDCNPEIDWSNVSFLVVAYIMGIAMAIVLIIAAIAWVDYIITGGRFIRLVLMEPASKPRGIKKSTDDDSDVSDRDTYNDVH